MKFLDLSKKEIKENPEIDTILEKEEIFYAISESIIKYFAYCCFLYKRK